MRFCLEVWGTDYQKIKDTCILAEKLGYYGFYYGESLAEIDLDCWSVISNLSAMTATIKLGPVITYLIPQYRNIALLAKQSATLQEISNGRLEFRTGAGATHDYAVQWWYPFGIDYPNRAERISLLDEGLQVLRSLWSKPEVHFSGKYFKINGANLKNPTTPISITVAAKRKKMMQVAAKHADIWESSYLSPVQFSSVNSEFEEISKESKITKTPVKSIELDVIIANSDSELEYKKRLFAMERGPAILGQLAKHSLVGKPEDIIQKVREYDRVGIEQFFLAFQDPFEYEAIQLFMNTMKGFMSNST
ncbi:MAG: LLM class flavin-dependent oxidoreductase [Candidatus Nitrosopolaris sp.]|jgi:alkanesulfonate monooxygenase SsuD/methylene tetrahydromethanopterin reductase-like flavin-dependent oxidoreductase (luciferase family)